MEQNVREEYRVPMYLFHEGSNARAYEFLGAHRTEDGKTVFRVWAPNAVSVSVAGEFNGWSENADCMYRINGGDIWEAFVEGVKIYDSYKYCITSKNGKTFMIPGVPAFIRNRIVEGEEAGIYVELIEGMREN